MEINTFKTDLTKILNLNSHGITGYILLAFISQGQQIFGDRSLLNSPYTCGVHVEKLSFPGMVNHIADGISIKVNSV